MKYLLVLMKEFCFGKILSELRTVKAKLFLITKGTFGAINVKAA
ncbi:hypothetical protein [Periweissella beninensis]|nr:hypothetical protein [Periweissella beninensis]